MSAKEEADRMKAALSYITLRMWGGDAPTHPDIEAAFDKVLNRAYSTDRAWEHIGKMCESAARKAGDAEARLAALRAERDAHKQRAEDAMDSVSRVIESRAKDREQVARLTAERDESAKAERERIARKFDDKATTCRAMLKVETNIGRLAELTRAVAEWEFCAAMAREEAK